MPSHNERKIYCIKFHCDYFTFFFNLINLVYFRQPKGIDIMLYRISTCLP